MRQRITLKNHFLVLGLISVSILTWGCTKVGPDYSRPELETDAAFKNTAPEQLDPKKVIRFDWWKNFNDKYLDDLIGQAIVGSYDLKILLGRIKAAGTMVDQSASLLYPSLDAETGARFADSKAVGATQSYNASATLSWELDLWGKNRREVEASKAELEAVKAMYRGGYLTLVSDVAHAYFTIRQYDAMEQLIGKSIKNNELFLTIYKHQYKEGIVGEGKILRQRAQVNTLRQEVLEMLRGREIQEHKVAALLGRPPLQIKVSRSATAPISYRLPEVPVGLPSTLLNRRPDILSAEYRLLKASQQIGIAQAARLPSISLTAQGGILSTTLSALLSGGVLSFVPNITMPIFDAGKRKAEVEKRKYEFEVAKNRWAKTANDAFREVADALTNLDNRKKQHEVIQARVNDMKDIQSQLKSRLELGLVSQLELIDIEENLYAAEKELLKNQTLLFNDTVLLYKALGGGWPVGLLPKEEG